MTRTARSHAALTLAVIVGLTLAGCADADEPGAGTGDPTPSATASATAEPTETATPTPTPTPTPAPEPAGTTSIATPADGSTVAGPHVEVTGAGTGFEGTLRWRVLRAGTAELVIEDFTTAGANGEIGPFAFSVELGPGSYTLELWEPDESGVAVADPDRHNLVTSTFTVS